MAGGGGRIRALNVAEKPSVAKAVSQILSTGSCRMREGRSRYNKIFEFNYPIDNINFQMSFTSVTGHLMELEFEDNYRKWHSCNPRDLYEAPVRKFVPQDKADIQRTLEEEARACQYLILWLDCDREGENIAFEVVDVCSRANRNLKILRARFSALIEREIHDAVKHAVRNNISPNRLFADAVDVRQEIDLRIGASFTRFQTMHLRDAFVLDFASDVQNVVLSYGPCQFPTLGFVVERFWENQSHEPEEFWSINCSHNSEEGTATFNWMRGHLFDHITATILYEMCIEDPIATVTRVLQQEKFKHPPHPLSTIELEKRASRYFRMSSEQTMKVAEDLYQAGFISYPRTETDSFSERTDLHTFVQEQQQHPTWGSYAQRLLDPSEDLWKNPRGGGHDDKAHPPIHPTKAFAGGEARWSQDHHKIYELVARHFLACVSQPAKSAETTVDVDIAGEQFCASGRVILARNYLDVYRFETWGGSVIPTYNYGQQFTPTTLTLDSGVTRPQPLLSEADLLSRMDQEGIGTDATMHDHIKKLLDRFYATKDSNMRFSPTPLGEALVMGYDDMGRYELWKPEIRAKMERDMKAVSMGTKGKADVLKACLQEMKAYFMDATGNKAKLSEAMALFFERSNRSDASGQHAIGDFVRKCGVCQVSNMVLRKKPDGNFMVGCSGYPQCRNVVWLPGSVSEATVTTNICSTCTTGPVHMIQFKFRRIEIPPNFNVNHLGCIGGCDDILKQLIEICGTGSRSNSSAPGRGQGHASSTNTAQQNNRSTGAWQAPHSSSSNASETPRGPSARSRESAQNESSIPCSTCGAPCNKRTANTEANRGRKFYSCQGCNFFVWEDANNGGATATRVSNNNRSASNPNRDRGPGRGRGRGRGRRNESTNDVNFVSATGEPINQCFICHDPSHFANACPNRGGGR